MDIVLISSDIEDQLISMNIDEEQNFVLTKIVKKYNGEVKKTESDHNIIETEFLIKITYNTCKPKHEMYNLKNQECQLKFKEHTDKTHMADIFQSPKSLEILTVKFLKQLDASKSMF